MKAIMMDIKFMFSIVPLKLGALENESQIEWQNPMPSSTRHCQLIQILFTKGTAQLTRIEIEFIATRNKFVRSYQNNSI